MNQFIQQFSEQLIATSILEWLAVCLAITYLILAIKESLWCWPAAFFSTAIYIYLFFNVNLYMESFLNFYYLIMAIYGWKQWQGSSQKNLTLQFGKKIIYWKAKSHLWLIVLTLVLVVISSWLLQTYTNQDLAVLDSLTTWFAILATYMVTQKVIENWLYWIIIDAVSIYLYLSKGFALTAILFLSYIVLAIIGWLSWRSRYLKQQFISSNKKKIEDNDHNT